MALEFFTYRRYAAVKKFTGNGKYVIIPRNHNGVPVTEILDGAFAGSAVEAVVVPAGLKRIGANAFSGCKALLYIGFPPGAEWVFLPSSEEEQQEMTKKLLGSRCIFPPSLEELGEGAFEGCTTLERVEFRAKQMTVGDRAFYECRNLFLAGFMNLEKLELGTRVFMNSGLVRFVAPGLRLNKVPDYTFANCRNLDLLVAQIGAVGDRAFYRCENLRTIHVFGSELSHIGHEAFAGCTELSEYGRPLAEWEEEKPAPGGGADPVEASSGTPKFMEDWEKLRTGKPHQAAESVAPPETVPDTEEEVLCSLQLHYRGRPGTPIPDRLKGTWAKGEGVWRFHVASPSSLGFLSMELPADVEMPVRSLLEYIVREEISTVLEGRQEGRYYRVREMVPAAEDEDKYSAGLFREMIRRLRQPRRNDGETVQEGPFQMRTMEEFEAMVSVCKSRLPKWVLDAYYRNKAMVKKRTGFSSASDEEEHAKKAISKLLNIDWTPKVLTVPPAEKVREILDSMFFGMEDVKIRVEEVVSLLRRTKTFPRWGILLNGPAGVGKTTIAKAIAVILGVALIQLDMSSMGSDPDEVAGSSRIYSNAKPGILVESMYRARSSTAVLLCNELDKAGEGKGGRSVADILLSILDHTGFYENFLEEQIPTDNLFAIGTCNDLSEVSQPIRDRFLIINVGEYSASEKQVIFRDYVFPAALRANGMEPDEVEVQEEAVELLTTEYATEAGARDLEKIAERLLGHHSRNDQAGERRIYTAQDIRDLLGPGRAVQRVFAIRPGEVNAALYHEGRVFFYLMEALVSPGTGQFEVLGPMGAVQKQYCKVAYLHARSCVNRTVFDFSSHDVTIFVPQPIPDGMENQVGFACFSAICAKVMNRDLALRDICFVGGCDLYGSLYFDENNLTPLLRAMEARKITTLYAPAGTNRLVDPKVNCRCGITVIEAPDAMSLFTLAVARNTQGS